MIEKVISLIVIPAALIYIAVIARQRLYAYIGIVFLFLMILMAFPDTAVFFSLHENYFPWVTEKMIFNAITTITIIVGLILAIHCYKAEAKAKKEGNPIILKSDFRKILAPSKGNITFWIIIIIYYISTKIFLGN